MKRKFNMFLENAGVLQEAFAVTPLLYGSLGLAVLTGEELRPEDIDILLPERMLSEEWQPFKTVLEANGYLLADEKEHTFQKDGVAYSYASLEELEHFAGIPLQEISLREEQGVRFYLLSPEQYLAVYRKSSLDGYRVNTRCKKDGEKIALLEHMIQRELARLSRMFFKKYNVHRYRMKKVQEMDDRSVIQYCHWFCEEQSLVEEFVAIRERGGDL